MPDSSVPPEVPKISPDELRAVTTLVTDIYSHNLNDGLPPWDSIGHSINLLATAQVDECRTACKAADRLPYTEREKIDLRLINVACAVIQKDAIAGALFERLNHQRKDMMPSQVVLFLQLYTLAVCWGIVRGRRL